MEGEILPFMPDDLYILVSFPTHANLLAKSEDTKDNNTNEF